MVQINVFKAHRCSAKWNYVIFFIFKLKFQIFYFIFIYLFIYLRPHLSQPFVKGKKGPYLSVPHLDLLAMSRPVGKVGIPQNSDSSARQAKAFKTALPVCPALTPFEVKQKEKKEKEDRKRIQEEKAKANEEK